MAVDTQVSSFECTSGKNPFLRQKGPDKAGLVAADCVAPSCGHREKSG